VLGGRSLDKAQVIAILLMVYFTNFLFANRFSDNLQQMIREMRALFGDNMWDNILVGVSKWSYSEKAVEERNRICSFTPGK
jgi:hypothetical protein